jgi:aldose 1-epimerase
MPLVKEVFGKTKEGVEIERFTLANAAGMKVAVMTYGATLTAVEVPDRRGRSANVILHLDSFDDYEAGHPCFGAVCGRFADRIAKGRFTLDGRPYVLAANAGCDHLHGGVIGFDKRIWTAKPVEPTGETAAAVELTYVSPDGEEGYPGALATTIRYSVTNDQRLILEYTATTDKPTVLNLTNHAYWNLSGEGDILDHELTIHASRFLPIGDDLVPIGELRPVEETPMDFTSPHSVGSRIARVPGGYDHCYVLDRRSSGEIAPAATVVDRKSGRVLEQWTTEPGIQFYAANDLNRTNANGTVYRPHAGLCLEAEHFADSPNHANFPSTVLRPGEVYRQTTIYRFSAE